MFGFFLTIITINVLAIGPYAGYYFFIFTACLILQLKNIKTNKKCMTLDKKIGDYSFSIYIFHWNAALIVFWLLTVQNIQISKPNKHVVIFLSALATSFVIGTFANKFNDKYIEKLRKKNRSLKSSGSLTKI
jgi:peptidoglycan/LPS O-acetylase OafA/YrhL